MDNGNDLFIRMSLDLPNYSPAYQKLARTLLSNPHECALSTINTLARKAGVSEATIIKFTKHVGLDGYAQLRKVLQGHLRNQLFTSQRVEHTLHKTNEPFLAEFFLKQKEYFEATVQKIPPSQFLTASKLLAEADHIYLYGEGAARTPCHAMEFWLPRFSMHAFLLPETGSRLLEPLLHTHKKDLIVAFVLRKQTYEIEVLLNYAKEEEIQTLLITDLSNSILELISTCTLRIERGPLEEFHSMAVPVALADALVLEAARIKGNQALSTSRKLEELRKKYFHV